MSSQAKKHEAYGLRTKRLALCAILAAMAMILSYIEALIPMPVPVPGIKIGLANLIVLIAIYRLGFKYAFVINCLRIFTAGLLFNGRRDPEHSCNVRPVQVGDLWYCRHKHGRRRGSQFWPACHSMSDNV